MDEFLEDLEKFARLNKIPVIVDDTRDFLIKLCKELKPKRILEIGMAIGYSASVMLKSYPQAKITCIEASLPNIEMAKVNLEKKNLDSRVNIIEGDCMLELPK